MLNSIQLLESEDDRYRAQRIRKFCGILNGRIAWIESFKGDAVLGLFKFFNFGYNTNYTTSSFGEIFLKDVNAFDHLFLFHEIRSIEIISNPITLAFFEEREIGHFIQEEK